MKRVILLVALIAASFSFAFAEGNSKTEIDAAMKAGYKALNAKIIELETNLRQHNTDAAQAASGEVLALMRRGVSQTRQDANLLTGSERDVRYKHMLDLENIVITYMKLSGDVDLNANKLVETARNFLTEYK